MGTKGSYLHGTSEREQARLARMNALINRRCLEALGLGAERSVLDVGSGLGHFSREMAVALGPAARVLGIELDERQLAEARRLVGQGGPGAPAARVEFRQGRAEDPPLGEDEWGRFDLAHARFLLEHHAAPLDVVRAMVRAVRPGGRVVLADDDHDLLRLWPEPPSFLALWRAYVRLYDRNGNDPFVGRRLVSLLVAAGAEPRRNTWIFYGSCAGDPEFAGYVDNLIHVLLGVREALVAGELLLPVELERGLEELARWGELPDAALWYGIAWAEGCRRA